MSSPGGVAPRSSNPFAVAALILGLVALGFLLWRWIPLLGFVLSALAAVTALTAIISGHVALGHAKRHGGALRPAALWGLGLGYGTLVVAVVAPLVTLVVVASAAVEFLSSEAPGWIDLLRDSWEND